MQDENNPNSAIPQVPTVDVNPPNPIPQAPIVTGGNPIAPSQSNEGVSSPPVDVSPQVPQGQDKSDAMTYPLGSQNAQPGVVPPTSVPEEDHRTILDRIMGIFSKGKKIQPESDQVVSVDQAPTNATPPPIQ